MLKIPPITEVEVFIVVNISIMVKKLSEKKLRQFGFPSPIGKQNAVTV
jgi:hypothetical protein